MSDMLPQTISQTEEAKTLPDSTSFTDGFSSTSVPHSHSNLSIPKGCMVLEQSSQRFIPWDNPHNVVTQDAERAVDAAISSVCLPILFVISVPSNFLNMLVFWKQGLKERVNLCLFCLSLVDFLHLVNSLFANMDRLVSPFDQSVGPVTKFFIRHKLIGFRGFYWLSGFVSTLIACDRCLCVVSPLRSATILKTGTTACILVVGTVLIMTGSMVNGLRWGVACMFNQETNTTSSVIFTSQFHARHKDRLNALTFLVGTLQPFTYVTVVMTTTIVTSVKLRKMMTWREQTSSSVLSSREVALTRTLIAVSVVYVMCSVPTVMSGVGVIFVPGYGLSGRYYNLANLVVHLAHLASYINATLNFFVYCFLGSRFKETLCQVLRCKCVTSSAAAK